MKRLLVLFFFLIPFILSAQQHYNWNDKVQTIYESITSLRIPEARKLIAIEKLKNDPTIDLIFTDINMPVMDGIQLLGHLHRDPCDAEDHHPRQDQPEAARQQIACQLETEDDEPERDRADAQLEHPAPLRRQRGGGDPRPQRHEQQRHGDEGRGDLVVADPRVGLLLGGEGRAQRRGVHARAGVAARAARRHQHGGGTGRTGRRRGRRSAAAVLSICLSPDRQF